MPWFQEIRGNAKGCLVYEPMFVIPYSLYITYATIYMLRLGLNTTQIGMIASLGMILQMFNSAISGHVTDRLGRRRALLTFDMISWSLGTLMWAVAQNVWFFVIAAIFNSFQKIPNTAWYCLLVEDTEPKHRSVVFTALQFVGVIGGLFTPLGGLLIDHWNLIPSMRILYVITFISMTAMFILRNRAVHETNIGLRKMAESKSARWSETVMQHTQIIGEIFRNRSILAVFAVYVLNNFQMAISGTFLSVYEVSALHIPTAWISLFPAVASVATLLLMYFVVPRLQSENPLRYVMIGFAVSLVATTLLIFAPIANIAWVSVTAILSAAGALVANPFLETLTANSIRDEERAKFLSVLTVLILLFTWPSGVIGGWTYLINPRLTISIIALTLAVGLIILLSLWLAHHTTNRNIHNSSITSSAE